MLAAVACGGGGGGTPPTPHQHAQPATPASPVATDPATTITITAAGVSPKEIQVAVGGRVTFVNNDNAFHEMTSDPHPIHTDCPEINAVGALGTGHLAADGGVHEGQDVRVPRPRAGEQHGAAGPDRGPLSVRWPR